MGIPSPAGSSAGSADGSDRADAATTADVPRVPAGRGDRKNERSSVRPGGPQALVGVVLSGRYLIERLIGEGGMGAVYQAEHTHMRKRLAVKVLHPEMSRLPEVVARFEREAMAAAHIEHPNVAAATDFGKLEDGSFFLVLEYVEGRSLRDVIAEGRMELGRALHVARQMASALGRAHAIGIVHRDLKPENIMLVTRDGEADFVKVLDFGIAKVPVGELGSSAKPPGQALTQLGMVYGTPEYMAPEQALGQPVDPRADLYGLGVILFEMIAGTRPYEHESKVTLLGMHVTAPIPRLGQRAPDAEVPSEVEVIVTRLLAKDAADRYGDAKALVEAIDAATGALIGRGRIPDQGVPASSLAHSARSSGSRFSTAEAVSTDAGGPRFNEAMAGPVRALASFLGASFRHAIQRGPASAALASPRTLAASAAGAVLVLVALALIVTHGGGSHLAPGQPAGDAHGAATPPSPRDPSGDGVVTAAATNIEKGDFATAIEALTTVETANPDRPDVHLLLERAYTGVRNSRDAMREANALLTLDANASADLKLQEDIRNAALVKETQDDASALLESKMGSRGVDILFDIAYGASGRLYPQAAIRAKHSLSLEEVRSRASPALTLALEFRDAKTCDAKHALLTRARDQGDARILPTLQQYQATHGCGFLGAADCYPCMRKDALLSDAKSAVEDRAK